MPAVSSSGCTHLVATVYCTLTAQPQLDSHLRPRTSAALPANNPDKRISHPAPMKHEVCTQTQRSTVLRSLQQGIIMSVALAVAVTMHLGSQESGEGAAAPHPPPSPDCASNVVCGAERVIPGRFQPCPRLRTFCTFVPCSMDACCMFRYTLAHD
jgi:hypothetical protein